MTEFQELTPDEETFRRVWQRVMPEGSESPIAVGPSERRRPGQEKPAGPRPGEGPRPPAPEQRQEEILRQMLEDLEEGLSNAEQIRRQEPEGYRLLRSLRESAGQVRAAWLLLTGRRWPPFRPAREEGVRPGELLRRQYMWELRFSELCRRLGREARDEDVEEIVPELLEQSRLRRGILRRMLSDR